MIVAQSTLAREPEVTIDRAGGQTTVRLAGPWTAPHAEKVEALADEIATEADTFPLILDLGGVERLDTLGAWTINRTRHELSAKGQVDFANPSPEQKILLEEAAYRDF